MAFTPRLSAPEKGNKYYNTKANGGYSEAIKGNPTENGLDVLRNCVGYAYGRFNEIGNYGKMMYLAPVNAELFIDYKDYKKNGKALEVGQTPKLGACMVWQSGATKNGSDGAGHVAIVEKINSDGSIVTSESGYKAAKAFWTQTRTNANGRWGQNSNYTFLGFIYNPAVKESTTTTVEKKKTLKYAVGDIVYYTGGNHYNSANDNGVGIKRAASLAKITVIAPGAKYPYHCRKIDAKGNFVGGGVYGWVNEGNVTS